MSLYCSDNVRQKIINFLELENFNFERIGARHNDFSYNSNNDLSADADAVNMATNFLNFINQSISMRIIRFNQLII